MNIVIPEGSFTGIVGESGSGKSTITSLIMGRNSLPHGLLTIAGLDISGIKESSLFNTINYVGINSTFFKGTVRDNLIIADQGASDQKLWNVLRECDIDGFFKENKGLDTALTENAGNLSGGQRQRLALARSILHDAKIYIFDEATSNIDVESEETILSEIKKLAKNKTVIVISHRLKNVKDADCIYCMENGTVAGKGTHEQLLSSCNTYKGLCETQKELEEFGKEGALV